MKLLATFAAAGLLAAPAFAQATEKPAQPPAAAKRAAQDAAAKAPVVALGKPLAGSIVLKDIDGEEHAVADVKGKITVVNFWSFTCPIMQGWESRFAAIQREYGEKGGLLREAHAVGVL